MPPWFERDQPTPFDRFPIEGRRDLEGDGIALKYHQVWVEGKKYPIIHFPSGTEREITTGGGAGEAAHIHLFGSLHVPYQSDCDDAHQQLMPATQEQGYILSREHDQHLRIANPQTGRSYLLTYDNDARHLHNIELFPEYAMDLMPAEVRAVLPPLYSQETKELDAIALVKFFTPDSGWTWYGSEFNGEDILFGLVSGYEVELGIFSLSELESVRGLFGLPIERDLYYRPQRLSEIQNYERKLKGR